MRVDDNRARLTGDERGAISRDATRTEDGDEPARVAKLPYVAFVDRRRYLPDEPRDPAGYEMADPE